MGGLREELARLKREVLEATAPPQTFSPLKLAQAAGLELLDWHVKAVTSDAPRMLFNAARQSGKSTTAGLIAVDTALSEPGSLTVMVSRTLDHSGELYRKAHSIYQAADRPIETVSETALTMELANGSRIISRPGSSDISVRSYSADLLIVDEASRVPDELYFAALPVLAKTGGRLIALSTPFGERGWWWHAWEREGDEWERYEVPATELPEDWYEPSRDEFLDAERRRMGSIRYAQEYECSFEGTGVSLFPRSVLEGAVVRESTPLLLDVPSYWE